MCPPGDQSPPQPCGEHPGWPAPVPAPAHHHTGAGRAGAGSGRDSTELEQSQYYYYYTGVTMIVKKWGPGRGSELVIFHYLF